MVTPQDDSLAAFSEFYAVVLNHEVGSGRRVRWSPPHGAWLSSKDFARYSADPWRDEPGTSFGHVDAPYEDELTSAIALARHVLRPAKGSFFCEYCLRTDARAHFIAPNVHSEPELYCLQVPAFSVVASPGGNGQMKHWGSPFGCQSVDHHISTGGYGRRRYIGPIAAYVFGLPLPADEVINREWCSRCIGAAFNVRNNAASSGADEDEWAREQTRRHVGHLSRSLVRYYGD
jgi:hypothetical protein